MTAAIAGAPVYVEESTSPLDGWRKLKTRPVAGFDGEGITIGGKHRYTLLSAYQRFGPCGNYCIRDWRRGLSTERCLTFLLGLPWAGQYRPINVSYAFGYDVTMIMIDLSDEDKTTLYKAGWVVWRMPKSGRLVYIEYAPRHWLFIGEIGPEEAKYTEKPANDTYHWSRSHPGRKWLRIDDAFGFAQVSFVTTLKEHRLCDDTVLAYITREKGERSSFRAEDRKEIERYNICECALLCKFVEMLQCMCLAEDMRLPGWYGPGAMAATLLRKHGAKEYIADPEDPEMQAFIMRAASGGRVEDFAVGLVPKVYNGDIRSAYPYHATFLPDLKQGIWEWVSAYTDSPYSLWEVKWQIPVRRQNLMPFPYRDRHHRIWYPSSGKGVVHASEVAHALIRYPDCIRILRGLVYRPDSGEYPLSWLSDIAAKRLAYKSAGDGRHIPLKLGMNSVPGKFWQHAMRIGEVPPYQSYYAAGFITAATRAQVFDYVYSGGADASDLILIATDGVYTQEPRTAVPRGNNLGDWEHEATYQDTLFIRPGVYVSDDHCNARPLRRTRGFGRSQLDFTRACAVWRQYGIAGDYRYTERRFVGLGSCAGRGSFVDYARWIEQERSISYTPYKGIDNPTGGDILHLVPPAFATDAPGLPYSPRPPQDDAHALAAWADMQQQLAELGDQPG